VRDGDEKSENDETGLCGSVAMQEFPGVQEKSMDNLNCIADDARDGEDGADREKRRRNCSGRRGRNFKPCRP
jgi:hypothetical protein